MKRPTILIVSILFSLTLLAKNAEDIKEKHLKPLLSDLQSYIEKNPEAEDVQQATDTALQAAAMLDDPDTMSTLLMENFNRELDRGQLDTEALARAGMMAAQFALEQGDKPTAKSIHMELKKISDQYMDPMLMKAANTIHGALSTPAVGDAPELKGTDLNGEEVDLADYKGKVVMIDFWATWCGPCIQELPNVKRTYDTYHDKGFEIIGVSLDRDKSKLEAFIDQRDIAWTNLYDPEQKSSLATQFAVRAIPTILLLDKEGKIAAIGPRGAQLEKEVVRLLEQDAE